MSDLKRQAKINEPKMENDKLHKQDFDGYTDAIPPNRFSS
jgi:hypothetical protein